MADLSRARGRSATAFRPPSRPPRLALLGHPMAVACRPRQRRRVPHRSSNKGASHVPLSKGVEGLGAGRREHAWSRCADSAGPFRFTPAVADSDERAAGVRTVERSGSPAEQSACPPRNHPNQGKEIINEPDLRHDRALSHCARRSASYLQALRTRAPGARQWLFQSGRIMSRTGPPASPGASRLRPRPNRRGLWSPHRRRGPALPASPWLAGRWHRRSRHPEITDCSGPRALSRSGVWVERLARSAGTPASPGPCRLFPGSSRWPLRAAHRAGGQALPDHPWSVSRWHRRQAHLR